MVEKSDFKVYVGIPAYNAEKFIAGVIDGIKKTGLVQKIIVIDDGSTDNTCDVVRRYKDVFLLKYNVNKGYGGTQKHLFKEFLKLSKNPDDVLIILHSDGQTLPEEIPLFAEKFQNKNVDLVLGSRVLGGMRKGGMPLIRIIGDSILTIIENFCFGMDLTTYASGYRGFRHRILRRMYFDDLRNRHTFDTEILVRANESKAKMVEIPVATVYDSQNLSNYSLTFYSFIVVYDAVRYRLKKIFGLKDKKVHEKKIKDYWKYSRHDWYLARKKGNIFEKAFFALKGNYISSKVDYKNKIVLDCGCGSGVYTFDISKKAKMAVGLDISEWALRRAGKRVNTNNIFFLAGDSERLPFRNESFDVVVNTAVFQYYENPVNMVSEMRRVLKPNGLVLCEVPYKFGLYNLKSVIKPLTSKKDFAKEPINRCYSEKEFKNLFSGFKILKINNFFNFILFGIFRKVNGAK